MKIDNKDKDLLVFSSSPVSFEHSKDVILYYNEGTIILDEV